jgi:TrmH family RNA methyltransferase
MGAMENPEDRDRLRVVLVRTRNPLNIGAVARVMSNFGFLKLRLVQPWEPSFREARSAVGAVELLQSAEVYESVAEATRDCALVVGTSAVRDRELHQRVKLLPEAALEIRETLKVQNVALMFGSEKTGLSSEDLSHCNLLINIATRAEHVSLNLAQAVAVSLYEIAREETRVADIAAGDQKATASNLERITTTLIEALSESGYVKGESASATEQKVRRLVRRMQLNEEDAELWLGMIRKILGRLRRVDRNRPDMRY